MERGAAVAPAEVPGASRGLVARGLGAIVWTEWGRRHPVGPAIALLRIATCHPMIWRESLASATGNAA